MKDKEFLRYLDLFGTKCCFYSDQRLKLYTPLGGIISIISICAGILIFILSSLSSFKKEHPSLITSSIIEEEQKILFNQENIYIPWKLKSSNNINNSNILYPIIKYYYKKNGNDILHSKIISYRLCNESSMVKNANKIIIDSPLDQLYCIDMDNLYIGGSQSSNYLYYIEFNLYLCQSRENEKNNMNCISEDKLIDLQFIFYYPTVRIHQDKYDSPIEIKYDKNYVLLDKNVLKINQIFLRKVFLNDEIGLFASREKIYKYWGCSSINQDFYLLNNNNEEESRLFSLNIFVEQNTSYYQRRYKDIYLILAECLPLINLVHNILKLLAKIFKLSSINRKMTELLFENLTEKPNKFQSYIRDAKAKSPFCKKGLNKKRISNKNFPIKNSDNILKFTEENHIISTNNKDNPKNFNNLANSRFMSKLNANKNINISNKVESSINISIGPLQPNLIKSNEGRLIDLKINTLNLNNLVKNKEMNITQQPHKKRKKFISTKLFPYSYYLCTIFTKNIDLTKHPFCMSKKFVKVYYFLCQLFDISSYCILQKEFNVTKNFIFDEKNLRLIEQNSKINVNDQFFMRDMNDCIIRNKFHILGINNIKKKNNTGTSFSPDKK